MLITFKKIGFILPALYFLINFVAVFNSSAQDLDQIKLAEEYAKEGDVEKALDIYSDLAKDERNIPFIHKNYFGLLLSNSSFKEAERYINRIIKQFPNNISYRIDKGIIIQRQGNNKDADKYFSEVINEVKKDQNRTRVIAQNFLNYQMTELAAEVYKESRKAHGNPYLYALEMAYVYRIMNKTDLVINEYLNFVDQNPGNINYVKNSLQNLLTTEEDLNALENLLIDKVQSNPGNHVYTEMLIWVYLQQKNFYAAFMQARALDKRLSSPGNKVMEIGAIALENKDYETSIKIFSYVVKEFPETPNYVIAKRMVIKAREEYVKVSYPVKKEDIIKLIEDYDNFVKEVGINQTTLEAQRSKAQLYAFYLDDKEKAIEILNDVIGSQRANANLQAYAKLDLGDIYILTDMPWESTLLYSQVEKSHKEDPIGYEAKLRNAKLSYFKGDFELAIGHLDVLKTATTREISNDAMALSLLIKDNTALDSSDHAMKEYAHIELLLFQNKKDDALSALDELIKNHKGHSLTDEAYWLKAQIYREIAKFNYALEALEFINTYYPEDILGDDAFFLTAKIYDVDLQDKEKAMEYYQNFLVKYKGSIYVAEARKRFRKLRGDIIN
jgi:tetratricopeptide (TPR) repeat protein